MTVPATATIVDTFHRTVTPGWGTSNSGHVWSSTGVGGTVAGTDSTVTTPVANHSVPTTTAYRLTYLAAVSQANLDMSATGSVTFSGAVAGGVLELLGVAFRAASLTSYYLARIEVAPGGSMTLKLIAPDAVTTLAAVTGIVGGLTYTSAKALTIRIQAIDTLIRIKVWDPAAGEPATWDISLGDTSSTAAGFVGLRSGVGAANTNTKPVVFAWTEFWVAPAGAVGKPFLRALLGPNASIVTEAAFGADLTDAYGLGWVWTELSDPGAEPRHDPGIPVTIGRSDNVSTAGAASFSATMNNADGRLTPENPTSIYYPNVAQNTPIRERMTLDGTTWKIRFQGYLDSANPVTDQSATVKGVALTALGELARLGGLKKPLKSPLYRAQMATAPVAYWPLEDAAASTSASSAVSGGSPMALSGAVAFADAGPAGSAPLPDFSGAGTLTGVVTGATAGSWCVTYIVRVDNALPTAELGILRLRSGSLTFDFTYLNLGGGTNEFGVSIVSATGTTGGQVLSATLGLTPDWHVVQFCAVQNGADIQFSCYIDGVTVGVVASLSATALGTFTTVIVPTRADVLGGLISSTACHVGHVGVTSPATLIPPNPTGIFAAVGGYAGESASDRLIRLCAEEGIALDIRSTSNVLMGPQGIDAILPLLREPEAADHGLMYDGVGPGIGYQCRSARYNAPAALTLDMGPNLRQVETFAPVFDKQAIKNLYVVSGKAGGAATAEQTAGALGTTKIGVADGTATVNVADLSSLFSHAAWLVHLGTVEGFRFPATGLNMRAIASLAASVLGVRIGDRITINNPASKSVDLPPDPIDLIVEGWTETTSASTWALGLNTSPYPPWIAAAVQDPTSPWVVAPGAAFLNAGMGTTDVSASIKSTDGTLLSTLPADYPRNVVFAGEEITISSVTGVTSPQTAVIVRSVNGVVKPHVAGEQMTLYRPAGIAL